MIDGQHTQERDLYPTRKHSDPQVIERQHPVVHGSPESGPMESKQLQDFAVTGFTTIDSILTTESVREVRSEFEDLGADPAIRNSERCALQQDSDQLRSLFAIHELSSHFRHLLARCRIIDYARQILGSDVYIHQSRVNFKPGFGGADFFWHADFETWHAEDGLPTPRAVSMSITLTDNYTFNGPLMIVPSSHMSFIPCTGATPDNFHEQSLTQLRPVTGIPDTKHLTELITSNGIAELTGAAGSMTIFDANCLHGSNGNITPYPRSNIFIVFNSVHNLPNEPYSATTKRPDYLASPDYTPV